MNSNTPAKKNQSENFPISPSDDFLIEVHCTGFGLSALANHTIKPQIPLRQDELQAVCQAGIDAAAAEYARIHSERKQQEDKTVGPGRLTDEKGDVVTAEADSEQVEKEEDK